MTTNFKCPGVCHERRGDYFIKDLGVGSGAFVRQEASILLKDNMLINVGEAYIVVSIIVGSLI